MFLARQSGRKIYNVVSVPCASYNMKCEKGRWKDRIAVITGAGCGIGEAVAKEMVKNKIMVVGLDVRMDNMEALHAKLPKKAQSYFQPIECDVTKRSKVNKVFDCICDNFGGVDILVNNAGILIPGQLVKMPPKDFKKTMDTNIMGVLYCTQRALKSMTARKFDGHIINISSIVGHIVPNLPPGEVQDMNVYPPSKFAVKALTETLRQELRGLKQKIKVTNISPGVTDTAIVPASIKTKNMLKPDDIAAGIMYAIFSPPHVNVHELTIKPIGEMI